jgi:hypothetical protein
VALTAAEDGFELWSDRPHLTGRFSST